MLSNSIDFIIEINLTFNYRKVDGKFNPYQFNLMKYRFGKMSFHYPTPFLNIWKFTCFSLWLFEEFPLHNIASPYLFQLPSILNKYLSTKESRNPFTISLSQEHSLLWTWANSVSQRGVLSCLWESNIKLRV